MVQSAIRARFERHEAKERAARRTAARSSLPAPASFVGAVALALCEIEAGLRSIQQLERISHPSLWPSLHARVQRRGGPYVSTTSLLRVHLQEVTPGLVEAVAVVRRGQRVAAIAMQLDGADGRWELIALQY